MHHWRGNKKARYVPGFLHVGVLVSAEEASPVSNYAKAAAD
jgi:hypothetical protein